MKRKRTIILSVAATVLFSLAIVHDEKNQTQQFNSLPEYQIRPINFNSPYSDVRFRSRESIGLNRDEILKKSLKSYRDETYWGNEHPVFEQTKHLNDKEFSRFVQEEIREKDVDVYWGAEY